VLNRNFVLMIVRSKSIRYRKESGVRRRLIMQSYAKNVRCKKHTCTLCSKSIAENAPF